jgi:hypothetical protein
VHGRYAVQAREPAANLVEQSKAMGAPCAIAPLDRVGRANPTTSGERAAALVVVADKISAPGRAPSGSSSSVLFADAANAAGLVQIARPVARVHHRRWVSATMPC